MHYRTLPLIGCFVFTTIFCIHYVFAKEVLQHTDAMSLACLRGLLGGLVLVMIYWKKVTKVMTRELIPKMMVPAFFGVILNQVLFLEGIKQSTPLHAAVLANTIPVFSTLLAIMAGFEKRSNLVLLGILVGSVSSSLYVLTSREVQSQAVMFGDFLILLNVFSIAISFLFFKKWIVNVDSRAYTAFALTFAGLVFLSFKYDDVILFTEKLLQDNRLFWLTMFEVFAATSLAYLLNFYALSKLHVSTVTSFIFIQPIVTESVTSIMGVYTSNVLWTDYIYFLGIVIGVILIMRAKRIESNS